ncbi:uncharacterized protein LOC106180517 [Lingula anatina]|uniref:E3 ubiquitin-protein ligase n=1 Tax=Lingula anatina TaxID=7574 RepID=A0A1S3KC14_LINAN|nr:uncharacterized protein LOC106180517 [Lingula anatina]|eukprot:XP_013419979.1 uncharacterized protein LOC106180517 [Lingula anatina]
MPSRKKRNTKNQGKSHNKGTLANFSSDEDENTEDDTLQSKLSRRSPEGGAYFVSSASNAVTTFYGYIVILLSVIYTLLLSLPRVGHNMCLDIWEWIKRRKGKKRDKAVSQKSSQSCPSPTSCSGKGSTPAKRSQDKWRKKQKPPRPPHHALSKNNFQPPPKGGFQHKETEAVARGPTYDLENEYESVDRQQEKTLTVPEIDLDYIRKTFPEEIAKIENDWGVKFVVIDGQLFAQTTEREEAAVQYHRKNEALEGFTTLYQKEMYMTNISRATLKDKSGRLSFRISKKYKRVCVRPTKNSSEVEVVGPTDQVYEVEREFGDSDRQVDRQGPSVREVEPHSVELSSISSRDSTGRKEAFHYTFPTGTKLTIKVADITIENTDAIVNAANEHLRHGGGVAAAISRAAGRSFQKDSEDAIRQHGPIPLGGVVTTRAGDLPCSYVIHVVGPTVKTPNYQLELQSAVGNVLDECRRLKVSTVAMPAISTGIFGVPKHEGALSMVRAIQDKLRKKSLTLREIRVVDKDYRTIDTFAEVFRRELQTMDDYYLDHEENNASFLEERRSKKHSDSGATVGSVVTNVYNKERISSVQRPPDHHFDHHGGPSQVTVQIEAEDDNCPICMDTFTQKTTLDRCRHSFCKDCLERALAVQNKCPICGDLLGEQRGNQPDGYIDFSYDHGSLPGYEGYKTIVIKIIFPDGIQQEDHPHPGYPYKGTRRTAFLPDTAEGREVKELLRRAFAAKLLFTVGRSVTTGKDDTVVWNDVHFKTNRTGGPQRYGYPDPTYLSRVKEELAAKGIK